MEAYRQAAQRRKELRKARTETRKQRAWELVHEAARVLKEEYGAEAVEHASKRLRQTVEQEGKLL